MIETERNSVAPTRWTWLSEGRNNALALTGSPILAVVNLLLLALTVSLLLTHERSVLTGILILIWGAIACWLAHFAGTTEKLDGKKVVLSYVGISVLLYVLLSGVYYLLRI